MPWDDFKSLIFFTPSNTRKYSNLKRNPSVSVFVDSTKNSGQDIAEALGLNISGEAEEIPESGESEKIRSDFIKRNPAMKEFVESPSVAMFRIMVRTYFFVERFQQVTEIHIDQWKK
jgi:nitroimidazol reductase NimA-like FMN-containing flavoprotein (pyridoxamine 5'-phosphate oxidase superfamily)